MCGKYGDIRDVLDEEAFVHTVEHEWELTEAVAKCTGKDFTVRNASGAEDGEILSMLRKTEDGHIRAPEGKRAIHIMEVHGVCQISL